MDTILTRWNLDLFIFNSQTDARATCFWWHGFQRLLRYRKAVGAQVKQFSELDRGRWAAGAPPLPSPPPVCHFVVPIAISCCSGRGPAGPHENQPSSGNKGTCGNNCLNFSVHDHAEASVISRHETCPGDGSAILCVLVVLPRWRKNRAWEQGPEDENYADVWENEVGSRWIRDNRACPPLHVHLINGRTTPSTSTERRGNIQTLITRVDLFLNDTPTRQRRLLSRVLFLRRRRTEP